MGQINYGGQRVLVGLASATSANGTAREGATQGLIYVAPGTLVVEVAVTIVTGSVVATIRHQVSNDNSTWIPMRDMNNAAPVTLTATGSVALPVPLAASAYKYYRCTVTLSGASTAAGDLTAATYRSLTADELFA